MRKNIYSLMFIINSICITTLYACPFCHTATGLTVRANLINHNFLFIFTTISAIFIFFYAIVGTICYAMLPKLIKNKKWPSYGKVQVGPLAASGMLLGGAIIGFLDGIIFHQILQWHSMIANRLPLSTLINTEVNMFWDGIFHLFTLIMMVISLGLLWKSLLYNQEKTKQLFKLYCGFILMGSGIFNLLEGLIDHHFLQLHHVIQQTTRHGQLLSDYIFIWIAVILLMLGVLQINRNLIK